MMWKLFFLYICGDFLILFPQNPMLLSKEIVVYFNLVECKMKQCSAAILRQKGINLTPEQLLLLDLLWNDGDQSQQQLADQMQKDKNSIKKLIDALEKKALVVRTPSKTDRRSNIIQLTDKAQEMKMFVKDTGIQLMDDMFAGISENELRRFLKTLGKMSKNMYALTPEER